VLRDALRRYGAPAGDGCRQRRNGHDLKLGGDFLVTYKNKGYAASAQPLDKVGSSGRTRTSDLVVNSHPLYQLSYRGSTLAAPE
jgi:hypothetical protein